MDHLSKEERELFKRLSTPIKIQDFLDALPINHEKQGDTCFSPRMVIRTKKAHCFEGALFAAAALSFHDEKPLILNLRVIPKDDDHAITLYKRNGYWGALSKTNHAVLRFRDPVYKTIRELVLSYFHEYFMNDTGLKTLRAYSTPLSLTSYGADWITSEKPLWPLAYALRDLPHTALFPDTQKAYLRKATPLERAAGHMVEWDAKNPRT